MIAYTASISRCSRTDAASRSNSCSRSAAEEKVAASGFNPLAIRIPSSQLRRSSSLWNRPCRYVPHILPSGEPQPSICSCPSAPSSLNRLCTAAGSRFVVVPIWISYPLTAIFAAAALGIPLNCSGWPVARTPFIRTVVLCCRNTVDSGR
ncbi:hypothetical protein D3C81_1830800 [compost metagenome]